MQYSGDVTTTNSYTPVFTKSTEIPRMYLDGMHEAVQSKIAELRSMASYQTPANTMPRYIAVEGCIGVGKTTLTHLIAKRFQSRVNLEVVEENPFLADFYTDKEANAFRTQMFFLLSRYRQQIQIAEQLQKNDGTRLVSDYLLDKDRIFATLTLQPAELAMYEQVFSSLQIHIPQPELVVYLRAPVDVIMARIAKRGRSFERNMDRNYIEKLVSTYESHFEQFNTCPLLVVDTEHLNFPHDELHVQVLIDNISQMIMSPKLRV